MTLFDVIPRSDSRPKPYSEPLFAFLNRCSAPHVGRVREVLEEWFSRYPVEAAADLRGKICSSNDPQHYAGCFELFMHELLLRLGCDPLVNPDPGTETRRRPDFMGRPPNDSRFLLECTVAREEADPGAAARKAAVYDSINRMESPNFWVAIDVQGEPASPVPGRQIRDFLQRQLNALDPDKMARVEERDGWRTGPPWDFEYDGWRVSFRPLPKGPAARGVPGLRPLGAIVGDVRFVNPERPIRAVTSKASAYGDPELPYIIAVNCLHESTDRESVMDALFGDLGMEWSEGQEARPWRKSNGALRGPQGPQNTRVSAVLVGIRLSPATVPRAEIRLYHNPWARRPYTGPLDRLPRAVPEGDRLRFEEGEKLVVLFELPDWWPGGWEASSETLGATEG